MQIAETTILAGDLLAHFGHKVVIARYGTPEQTANVALECETCNEVIADCDLYEQ